MRKTLVGLLVGLATFLTVGGLGVASAWTADLTLTVDGTTTALRVWGGQTVEQVLSKQDVEVRAVDYVSPATDTVVTDGLDIQVAHARSLTLTIDGDTRTITTTANTVGAALTGLGVDPSGAQMSVPPDTQITIDTTPVVVTTSKMISLKADGLTLFAQTVSGTVAQLLAERGITLGSLDRVSPTLDTQLVDDMAVVVQRVSVTQESATIELAYSTKEVKNATMAYGQRKVTTPGVKGKADQVWQVTLVDGAEESRELLSQTTVLQPVTEVVQVGTKGAPAPTVPAPKDVTPGSAQDIARQMLSSYGWGDDQFGCLVNLWNRESHWNYKAQNKTSGAYGIPQALPGSKMASAGADWKTNPATQIKWGLGYIKGRYGSPCGAWSHFQSKGWY